MPEPDPIQQILLNATTLTQDQKVAAWDAVMSANDDDTLQQRLGALDIPQDVKAALWDAKPPSMNFATVNGQPVSIADRAGQALRNVSAAGVKPDWLPAVGGMVGGIVGGVPGAAIGGAAGEGYRGLIQHAEEIPGALKDVAQNLITQPRATLTGFFGGAVEGQQAAMKSAAMQGVAEGAGQLVGKAAEVLGPRIMQSALKPGMKRITQAMKLRQPVPRVVQTLLDEGINVTPGGLEKLQTILDATNAEITAAVQAAPGKISKPLVATRAVETAQKFANQVDPLADLTQIGKTVENFLDHPTLGRADLTVAQAQKLKVGTYRQLRDKYGKLSSAGIETEKALARGLKEEIAHEVPDVSLLNEREGRILVALEDVGRRVALSNNRDPIGFAWVTHHPVTFLMALIDRHPGVKSMLARGLYSQAAAMAGVTAQSIRIAMTAITSGGGSDIELPPEQPNPPQ